MATAKEKKHQEFINQYFLCNLNQTEAYLKVYPKSSYDAARANSARLIADDSVKSEIEARIKELQMSADEALVLLSEQARGSLGEFAGVQVLADLEDHPKARLVKALTSDVYEDKAGKVHYKARIELHDAQSAIINVLKVHGKFKETTTNLNLDLSQLTNEQLQRIAAGDDPASVLLTTQSGG